MNAWDTPVVRRIDNTMGPVTLPWTFDTTSVWHTILKGAFLLNGVLMLGVIVKLSLGRWLEAVGVGVVEAVTAAFTLIFFRFQRGSRGTVFAERVVVEPNAVAGFALPGPRGSYPMENFRGVRVEYWSGRPSTSPNMGQPHEDIWLLGRPGTPDIVIAQTAGGAGQQVGGQFGALLHLPVEEVGKPIEIRL